MKRWYKWYVLFALTLVYIFNQLDRYMLTVLAPYIRSDFAISDTQLGFLYGTTFGLFYGLFGVSLGRLVDSWNRVSLAAIGLAAWSIMTTLSGVAANFTQLCVARTGVAVGEASGTPTAISLLCDYFTKRQRSTVLSLYTLGVFLGNGAALIIGGLVVAAWTKAYGGLGPFGITGWRAAFFVIGLPGIMFSLVVFWTIREPERSLDDHQIQKEKTRPFEVFYRDLAVMLPPWSIIHLWRQNNPTYLRRNIASLLLIAAAIPALTIATNSVLAPSHRAVVGSIGGIAITSNFIQWMCFGLIFYAAISWIQAKRMQDPFTYGFTIGSRTFMTAALSNGLLAISINAELAFNFVYATRYLGLGPHSAVNLGLIAIIAGSTGLVFGGLLGDRAKRIHAAGRVYLTIATFVLGSLAVLVQYTTQAAMVFYIAYAAATFMLVINISNMAATIQDLVPASMRGTAAAIGSLSISVIALGLGPYLVGLISDSSDSLRLGLLTVVMVSPITVGFLLSLARNIGLTEANLIKVSGEIRAAQLTDAPVYIAR